MPHSGIFFIWICFGDAILKAFPSRERFLPRVLTETATTYSRNMPSGKLPEQFSRIWGFLRTVFRRAERAVMARGSKENTYFRLENPMGASRVQIESIAVGYHHLKSVVLPAFPCSKYCYAFQYYNEIFCLFINGI